MAGCSFHHDRLSGSRLKCRARRAEAPSGRQVTAGRLRPAIVRNARYRLGVDTLTVDDYRIEPLTMRTWDAFADLAERHNGVWGGCWCTYFHLHPDPKEERRALGHREFKRRLVEAGRAHAALVFDG